MTNSLEQKSPKTTQPLTVTQELVDFPKVLLDAPNREYWESLSLNQMLQWLQVMLPVCRGWVAISDQVDYQGGSYSSLHIEENFSQQQFDELNNLGRWDRDSPFQIIAWLISRINPQEIIACAQEGAKKARADREKNEDWQIGEIFDPMLSREDHLWDDLYVQ